MTVAALAEMGRHNPDLLQKARLMFEQAQGYAGNHVGLLPEENSFSGSFQGNFPRCKRALNHHCPLRSLRMQVFRIACIYRQCCT